MLGTGERLIMRKGLSNDVGGGGVRKGNSGMGRAGISGSRGGPDTSPPGLRGGLRGTYTGYGSLTGSGKA